jgi:hypothetical protein
LRRVNVRYTAMSSLDFSASPLSSLGSRIGLPSEVGIESLYNPGRGRKGYDPPSTPIFRFIIARLRTVVYIQRWKYDGWSSLVYIIGDLKSV